MKNIYKFLIPLILFSFAAADLLYAQQEVTVRELNTYDTTPTNQDVLSDHPLVDVLVTYEAVVVAYPKNSGLATPDQTTNIPGRIHLFVTDVNAIDEGLDGMSMQLVVAGAERTTLEGLNRGDIIKVTGTLSFFQDGAIGQFDASDVEFIANVTDSGFEHLAPLLEPTVINLAELNVPADEEGLHRWVAENYTKYINRYVKIENAEVIYRTIEERPNLAISDGSSIMYKRDTSLRFRNDRGTYGYSPDEGVSLNYNYRRLAEELDGDFVPPAPGSVVDISGFVVFDSFDPQNYDESPVTRTYRIAPWDDGVLWVQDGDDPSNRLTPDGWPNDLVVLGFAPILSDFERTPAEQVLSDDEVTISINVQLPEDDYTLESVEVHYSIYPYTEDSGALVVEAMTAEGNNVYTFDFDAQDEFTIVEFEIVATAETPEGVQTVARESGSYFVESETQTSPVVFSPGAGTYTNQVTVSLSSATDDATIYYTTDGETPDENSSQYSAPITITETTTLTTIAIADGLDDSPLNARSYEIDVDVTEVSTIAELRAGAQDGSFYQFTGEAVVTYTRTNRNQKYIQDDTAGILIDDPGTPNIPPSYVIGSVLTDVVGSLSTFGGTLQFTPAFNPGDPQSSVEVDPPSLTLAELGPEHMSMLVRVEDVSFVDSGEFDSAQNYSLVDGSVEPEDAVIFRTAFTESNYIGDPIPEGVINLVGLVSIFNNAPQLTARSDADFEEPTSTDHSANPYEFSLSQNFPNPFNPSTRINYSLAETADVRLVVYDILGRRIATLVNEVQNAGTHTINFDMSRYASGTYIYRLEAGGFVSVKKMMLIK